MAVQVIAGTVSVTNGSANVVFSQAQTISGGTTLVFASQTGIPYQLLNDVVAVKAAVLTSPYVGVTAPTAVATIQRQVIIRDLDRTAEGLIRVSAVFWLVALPGNVVPQPVFVSLVNGGPNPPTAAEIAMLVSGQLVEQYDDSILGQTMGGLELRLAARYGLMQAALSSQGTIKSKFVGGFFDGNAWTSLP